MLWSQVTEGRLKLCRSGSTVNPNPKSTVNRTVQPTPRRRLLTRPKPFIERVLEMEPSPQALKTRGACRELPIAVVKKPCNPPGKNDLTLLKKAQFMDLMKSSVASGEELPLILLLPYMDI